MRLIHVTPRGEYWAAFDRSAGVWELFRSKEGSDYLGCFDSIAEALAYAQRHDKES
jgi:hypothetical protein